MSKNIDETTVVRFSIWWVLFLLVLTTGAGMAGGIVGQQFMQPDLTPLIDNDDGLTTVMQEVTISPNKAAAELVESTGRSVFLLFQNGKPAGMATAVTNDGLMVSASGIKGDLTAYDNEGREVTVEYSGDDPVFGVEYLRFPKTVVAPLDLRSDDAPVGQTLLAIGRDEDTFSAKIRSTVINQYELPQSAPGEGIQRVLRSSANLSDMVPGTPLLDEEGKIAGIWLGDDTVMPVNLLRTSLERFNSGQREINPLEEIGLNVDYGFIRTPEDAEIAFGVKLAAIKSASVSAAAGLKPGDVITAINDQPVLWKESIMSRIPNTAFTVTYIRDDQEQTTTIQLAE